MHIDICVHTYSPIHAHMLLLIHTYACTYTHTCTHSHTYAYTLVHVQPFYTHANTCMYILLYTCMHTHFVIHTLTHTCTCIHSLQIHTQLFIQALSLTCTHRYTQPNPGPPPHNCLKVPTHILCSLGAQPLGERFKGIQYCDRHIICLRHLIRVLRKASSGCLCACSVVLNSLRPHGL